MIKPNIEERLDVKAVIEPSKNLELDNLIWWMVKKDCS